MRQLAVALLLSAVALAWWAAREVAPASHGDQPLFVPDGAGMARLPVGAAGAPTAPPAVEPLDQPPSPSPPPRETIAAALEPLGPAPRVPVGTQAIDAGADAGESIVSASNAPVATDAGLGAERGASSPDDGDSPFRVRWGSEGFCGPRRLSELRAERDSLLASFEPRTVGEAQLLADPRLDGRTLAIVAERLQFARSATSTWIDWPPNAPPPVTIVYFDTPQLQRVACVNKQTVGYFDGKLHVSADASVGETTLGETVVHEYTHFALNTLGIPKPMWLHEGLAMHVAEESWWRTSSLDLPRWLRSSHLPFEAMVFAFPYTADERLSIASYYQSHRMVDFVVALRGPAAVRELVRGLAARTVSADEAFALGSGLSPGDVEPRWTDFVNREGTRR